MAYTDNEEPLMLNVLLGYVQIIASDDVSLRPVSVSGISCDDVTIDNVSTHSSVPPSDDTGAKCIAMRLQWCRPEINAETTSYHIW